MIHRVPCWECGIETEARDKARCPTCAEVLCPACRPTHESACERHDDALERRNADAVGQPYREARHQLGDALADRLLAVLGADQPNARVESALRGVAMDHALSLSAAQVQEAIESERQWAEIEAQREADCQLFGLHAEGNTVEMHLQAPAVVRGMVVAFREAFEANPGASNYLEVCAGDEHEQYIVTVRRHSGKTPHKLRREAEAARDAYRRALIESNRRRREVGR